MKALRVAYDSKKQNLNVKNGIGNQFYMSSESISMECESGNHYEIVVLNEVQMRHFVLSS